MVALCRHDLKAQEEVEEVKRNVSVDRRREGATNLKLGAVAGCCLSRRIHKIQG